MSEWNGEHGMLAAMPVSDRVEQSERAAFRRINSERLLAGGREVIVDHEGQEYHLRHTRKGGLILTKYRNG
jgi:hemin uptake protein HemP